MIDQLQSIKQLFKQLQQVPYLASKNLYRVATYFLNMDEQRLEQFCNVIISAKRNITKCDKCFVWKENFWGERNQIRQKAMKKSLEHFWKLLAAQ